MRILSEQIRQMLSDRWRRFICDEDPDDREERLRDEAWNEIDAKVQMAMQEWKNSLKHNQRYEVEAA
jgi:hypothetical protein